VFEFVVISLWVVGQSEGNDVPSINTIGQYGIAAIFIAMCFVLWRRIIELENKLEALTREALVGLQESTHSMEKVVAAMTQQANRNRTEDYIIDDEPVRRRRRDRLDDPK
jgi:hypothetical protein